MLRWHRTAEQAVAEANVVSFRRVGAIRPVGPDGTIRAYTSNDLRTHLAKLSVSLTKARKLGTVAPLVIALAGWFTIPSYAAARPGDHLFAVPGQTVKFNAPSTTVKFNAPNTTVKFAPAVAPAPPGQISDGPISVVPPQGATAPHTGAGDGIMRSTLVGLCLLLAGLVVLTAPRRNPHAEAAWREERMRSKR